MNFLTLLRDARTTGETVAAIDALLQLGYDLDRARRACRPAADMVDAALTRLPRDSQEGCEQAALAVAAERRLDRDARPLAWRLLRAEVICDEYERLSDECECEVCTVDIYATPADEQPIGPCEALVNHERADRIVDLARGDLRDSDEIREYEVRDEGANWMIMSRPSSLDEDVEGSVNEGDWHIDESWVWDGVSSCEATGEEDRHRVTLEVEEPACTADEHDWQRPYALLGGLKENPGVWGGPNGGITTRTLCGHCGAYRVFQSRKTNRNDGTTFEATDYEPADEDSLEWVAERIRADDGENEDSEIDADGDCVRCGHPANGSSGHGSCDGPAHGAV